MSNEQWTDEKKNAHHATNEERQRVSGIIALGKTHKCEDLSTRAVSEGWPLDQFRQEVLRTQYRNPRPIHTPDLEIGLTDREAGQFSFRKAILGMVTKDWRGAAFERECSDAVGKQLGRQPQGIFIPFEVQKRDLTKGTFSAGGALVATDILVGSFIDLLRNAAMVQRMGATVLGGLVGDVAIPKQSGEATAYWVGEGVAPTESQQTVAQLGLTPKTVGAYTDISRKLLLQSSMDVEGFVRTDLATILGVEIDRVAINGKGSAGEPLGILKTTGIGSVVGGTNGGAPTWALIVDLESEVGNDNAALGRLGYLSNSKIRGKLKKTEKAATTGRFIWSDEREREPGIATLNAYPAGTSNNVPSNLTKGSGTNLSAIIFGNWADLILAMWGALDLLVDPYTAGAAGTVRVRVLQDVDIAIRRAQSFSAMQDAITT